MEDNAYIINVFSAISFGRMDQVSFHINLKVNKMEDNVSVAIDIRMTQLSVTLPACYIFRVHEQLRNVNKKAYTPDIVSIGPYHKGNAKLQMMEEHKLRYFKLLLHRQGKSSNDYFTLMQSLEKDARECYGEPIKLNSNKFIEMLILDGCFIIELVHKFKDATLREKNDPLFRHDWIVNSLQRDLMLFENQLPFFVLDELFNMIVGSNIQDFYGLLVKFFSDLFPIPGYCADPENNMPNFVLNHLLEFVYYSWLPMPNIPELPKPEPADVGTATTTTTTLHISMILSALGLACTDLFFWAFPKRPHTNEVGGCSYIPRNCLLNRGCWTFGCHQTAELPEFPEHEVDRKPIRSATELAEANIGFQKINKSTILNIKFDKGVFAIPTLKMEDRTESFFRNMIAYEQYSQDGLSLVTNYVTLMDSLIDTTKDVDLLCRSGIIINQLGDDEVAADMFNKIVRFVTEPSGDFHYSEIFNKVNSHCNKRKNRWMANLRHNYMNSPWALISVLAAVVLLLLTFTQTFMSVFPR